MSPFTRFFGENWRSTIHGAIASFLGTLVMSNMVYVNWMQEVFGPDFGAKAEKVVLVLAFMFGVKAFSSAADAKKPPAEPPPEPPKTP